MQSARLCLPALLALQAAPARADEARLGDELARLRDQITREAQARADAGARWEEERRALEARRAALADQLLEDELTMRRLAAKQVSLEKESARLAAAAASLSNTLQGLRRSTLEASEQVGQLLREIPGEEDTQVSVEELEDSLRHGTADGNGYGQAARALWAALDRLHEQATQVSIERTEVWTARGERETVDLLSAGLIGFAYRTVSGDRFGLALASPAEASGYRFKENLGSGVRSALREAFESAGREGATTALVPIDVTGRIPAASDTHGETLLERLRSGGRVMVPILLVALVAACLILERLLFLFVQNQTGHALTRRVLEDIRAGQFEQAEERCRRGRGAVAEVLSACLRRRPGGPQAMEDSIQEQLLHEAPPLQRFLSGLSILAAVAPLLGLLGTVTGIIRTFGVLQVFGNANPGLMAGGISEALVTTAAGLCVAIPILLALGFLRGRVDRILSIAEKSAATLLNTLVHDLAPPPAPEERR